MFYCLGEPGYETSSWYMHIVSGLLNEKRSKRFTVFLAYDIDEIEKFPITKDDVLFIIGSSIKWLDVVIDTYEKRFDNRIVVLGNCERKKGKKYSIVASDVSHDIRLLYKYLKTHKKNNIAMYGINPHSASDEFRQKCFIACGADESDVYINNGDLKKCFDDFKQNLDCYDGIICANDYCAISLIRHLKERSVPLPFIVSCGETRLANMFSPSITNLKTNYIEFGKAGIQVAKMLDRNIHINSIDVYLKGDIVPGQTTDFLPAVLENEPQNESQTDSKNNFYADKEVDEMIKIEKLLGLCDKTDFELLQLVLAGFTCSEIADKLYMSTNGIKYKLKGMYKLCDVNNKNEFLKLVGKYIQN